MCAYNVGYLAVMYLSGEFQIYETSIVTALTIISMITYAYAVYIKPEYAQLPARRSDQQFLELLKTISHQPDKKICAYCQIEKTERARHCFICKRCVLEHDRHCFMLNNCVGKQNRPFVIAYLGATSILLVMMALSTIFHLTRVVPVSNNSSVGQDHQHNLRVLVMTIGASTTVICAVMMSYLILYCRSHNRAKKYQRRKSQKEKRKT